MRRARVMGACLVVALLVSAVGGPPPAGAVAFATWEGRWIWATTSSPDQWVAFRRTVHLDATPVAASARIAVDSKYWLWVNGRLVVFEGGLKRGPTPRDTYYDTVDLTGYLEEGDNTVAVLVWYFGRGGFSHNDSGHGGLLFDAAIETPRGVVRVGSDASWNAVVHPGYRHDPSGEQPNERLPEWNVCFDDAAGGALRGWQERGYLESAWPAAAVAGDAGGAPWNGLVARPIPPLHFGEPRAYVNADAIPQVSTGQTITGRLPSNLQVTPILTIDAPPGAVVRIRTDHYQDGGGNGVRATYVAPGGVASYESLGWMSGTCVLYDLPPGVRVLSLAYRESGYDAAVSAGLTCSDPFFEALWSKSVRSMSVNMRDSWMDCPTRERAQWMGDVVNELQGSAYAFGPSAGQLTAKAIRELAGWQRADRVLYSPVPAGTYRKEIPVQSLASVWGVSQYWLYTGDADTVAAVYPAMKAYVDLWRIGGDGLVVHRPGDVDWMDWGGAWDPTVVENAWYAMALQSLIDMAPVSGASGDVLALRGKLSRIRSAFDHELWDERVGGYHSRQVSVAEDRGTALAVVAGLVPAFRYPAVSDLLRARRDASPYLEPYVQRAMYAVGDAEGAVTRSRARYGPMVADEGRTLWEYWVKAYGSDDHGWGGGVAQVLAAGAAGLVPLTPGFSTFEVRPQLGPLERVGVSSRTVAGTIAVSAANTAEGFRLAVTAPDGTTGVLVVPITEGATVDVGGTRAYGPGATAQAPGVSVARETPGTLLVTVPGGSWTVASSARQPASGPGNPRLVAGGGPVVPGLLSVAGPGRIDTAVRASQAAFAHAETVVVATGYAFPDALGGSPLAGALDAPLLLVEKNGVPAPVATEIRRLGAKRVVLLGAEAAVGKRAADALACVVGAENVRRVGGADRYETAALIARETVAVLGARYDRSVFVATGEDFPDALAASPLAAAKGRPVLLTRKGSLPPPVAAALRDLGVRRAVVLGSERAVSKAAEAAVAASGAATERLAGSTRYLTALAVARAAVGEGLAWDGVAVTTGTNYPDALAGGVMCARFGTVLVLTDPRALTPAVAAELRAHRDGIGSVRFLGSPAAVGHPVRSAVVTALR